MRQRRSLIAGIVCGIACVAGMLLYAQELEATAQAERAEVLARFGGEQVEAYVAVRDIAAGETLDATNCEKRLWIGELLPQDAVLSLTDVEGKSLASPVYAGEVITLKRFSEDVAPSLQVPEGLCAVSVPAKPVSAVGGSIEAESLVDVYSTSGIATERIAASALVLSTSATVQGGDGQGSDISWITLAVDPRLVEGLIAAAQRAELYFVLPSEEAMEADGVLPDVSMLDEEDEGTDEGQSEGEDVSEGSAQTVGDRASDESNDAAEDGSDGESDGDQDDGGGGETDDEAGRTEDGEAESSSGR